ncbi:MAG: hypothetical protein Q9166_001477 [cf. Caloplaca sp. 2 TL-2023]
MDRLAPEIQHMIFTAAETTDTPNLRLTCKTLAAVGLEYLLPEVELLFTPKSFDRLVRIAEHPQLRHHVKSLVYRVDCLISCEDKTDWYLQIPHSAYLLWSHETSVFEPEPPKIVSGTGWRDWHMNLSNSSLPVSTQMQLEKAWCGYQAVWQEQQSLRDSEFGQATVRKMMANLPNLKRIALSNFFDITDEDMGKSQNSPAFVRTYRHVLADACGDEGFDHYSGVPQLMSLLRGIDGTTIVIESLSLGMVDWHYFEEEDVVSLATRALQRLKTLKMWMWMPRDAPIEGAELARRGRALAFLRSLPCLQVIDIAFDAYANGRERIDLGTVFADMKWPNLRKVSFDFLSTGQKDLIDFFERHAKTLRAVRLLYIELRHGYWPQVFKTMRDMLQLDDFKITGDLYYYFRGRADRMKCHAWSNARKIQDYVCRVEGTDSYDVTDLCNLQACHPTS